MKDILITIKRILISIPVIFIGYNIFAWFYKLLGGGLFYWLFAIPFIYWSIRIFLILVWDIDFSVPGRSYHSNLDDHHWEVYMSGDQYRIARYEQAKQQERLLEEQNRLLRERNEILKNRK